MSGDTAEFALLSQLKLLAPPDILIGSRQILAGDEDLLLPGEIMTLGNLGLRPLRQSSAARIVARNLLASFGIHGVPLGRSESGAPLWPPGFVGSMAHDSNIAIAAVATKQRYLALGIDVEPADLLPPELIEMVTTPTEHVRYPREVLGSRLLFVVKEAVYKAVSTLNALRPDFQDISVDLEAGQASIFESRQVDFVVSTAPRVVALAWVRASRENISNKPVS